jgi:hypothetical protein
VLPLVLLPLSELLHCLLALPFQLLWALLLAVLQLAALPKPWLLDLPQ